MASIPATPSTPSTPSPSTSSTSTIASSNIPAFKTPFKNRLQTAVLLLHCTSIILFCVMYFFMWCIPYLWPFMIYYTIFMYLLDKTPVNGNSWQKRSEWFRNLKFWTYLVDYFPIRLHKLQDLKPTFTYDKFQPEKRVGPKYIFGYHPHGIIATGVASGFTNNGANWNTIFPGIKCFVTTLVNQFQIPFYRDYLMAMGVTTVVKKNLKMLLHKGASIVIVVGGARESLMAKPGNNSIVLYRRKGFIKLALETLREDEDDYGICVVPVYGFGENDIYNVFSTDEFLQSEEQNKNEGEFESQNSSHHSNIVIRNFIKKIKKLVYMFQMFLKDNYGWTLPIVISRGIFNYNFGILPYRKPINVVFGKPIQIKRLNNKTAVDEITDDEVDYWHQKYVEGLKEVWSYGKERFDMEGQDELQIVE